MSLTLSESGGADFEQAPDGTHTARCYRIIDLGTQYSRYYGNWQEKLLITWELPNTPMENGKPFIISKRYTSSLNTKANLRGDLEAWRAKKFDKDELAGFSLQKVLGAPCMLVVASNEDGYANVVAVGKLPAEMNCPPLINEKFFWEMGDDPQKLPEWASRIVGKSKEMGGTAPVEPVTSITKGDDAPPLAMESVQEDLDDDIPFISMTCGPMRKYGHFKILP